MENILNIIILITACVGLTIFFIRGSDKMKPELKGELKKATEPWGKIMFWGFIIAFGIYLLLYGTKYS